MRIGIKTLMLVVAAALVAAAPAQAQRQSLADRVGARSETYRGQLAACGR